MSRKPVTPERSGKTPPSAWVALGPGLAAMTLGIRLFDPQRRMPAWVYAASLIIAMATVVWVFWARRPSSESPIGPRSR